MKRFCVYFILAISILTSCSKSQNPSDLSGELQLLKELGVDVSGMTFIYTSPCCNSFVTASYVTDAQVICVIKGSQYQFFIVNYAYLESGPQNELLTSFSLPYQDKGQITVDVGYGETKTLNFRGLQTFLGLYDNGNVYLPVMDWYLEPIPNGSSTYLGALDEKKDNPRMIIHSAEGTKIFAVDQINDSGLLAPKHNGGVLYNCKAYSSNGQTSFTFGATLNNMFFKPSDHSLLLQEWNMLSEYEYFGVRFDVGNTKYIEGILTYEMNLYDFQNNKISWYGGVDLHKAFEKASIKFDSSDRIESVTPVSKDGGIYKYKITGLKYSGNQINVTVAFNLNEKTVSVEQ